MSGSSEFQKAVFDALVADAGVHAVVADRIYDKRPASGEFPCITFGPEQSLENDADCITANEHILQIDCWTRNHGRQKPCKDIVAAVKSALHRQNLTIADPYALTAVRVTDTRVILDPDGVTAHGVVMVRARVEN